MQVWQRFKADRSGATAVIFGLSLLPVVGFAGIAVDYGRATAARTHLQAVADMTALALVRDAGKLTDAQLTAKAGQIFAAAFKPSAEVAMRPVTVTRDARTIRVAASGTMKTALLQVMQVPEIAIGTDSQVAWGVNRIELALVLDNTGSMDETPGGKRKIDELKKASARLLADLRPLATEAETIKVSIVPFDTEVRLDPSLRNAAWLRFQSPSDRTDWTGYVEDRDQPYDGDDTTPTSDSRTKYPARRASSYPAGRSTLAGDIAPIRPLTSLKGAGYQTLDDAIAEMRPRGYTNVGLGVAWGHATLSNTEPFTEAAAPSREVKKFMVVLTDGDNTRSRYASSLRNVTDKQRVDAIDDRTRAACESTKAAGITVFTIKLVKGNENLLQACASGAQRYFDVTDPSKLDGVFQTITAEITGTRYTH